MKRLVGSIFGLMLLSGIGYAACVGPYCWDESGAYVNGKTNVGGPSAPGMYSSSEIRSLSVSTTGFYVIACHNCARNNICFSTGTTPGSFVIIGSTGGPLADQHCQ